jgi:hypothetical protein
LNECYEEERKEVVEVLYRSEAVVVDDGAQAVARRESEL